MHIPKHILAAASLAVSAAMSTAQTIEFRVVEREGQTAITSAGDAELNFAIQARIAGPTSEAIGNFSFDLVIIDEPESFGSLAKSLTSNADHTYATTIALSASVGRGGLPSQYTYLAGVSPNFNGLINVSAGSFSNTPQQEIGLVAGSPTGTPLLNTPGLDVNGDGVPDTYPGSGSSAPLDPAVGAIYFGVGGQWIDLYRFRYTVSNLTTRTLRVTLNNASAQRFTNLIRNANSLWGAGGVINTPTAVALTSVPIAVVDSGACCSGASCVVVAGADCAGPFIVGGACGAATCQDLGSCCSNDGSCAIRFQAGCTRIWTSGGSCTPNPCAQPGACCVGSGACTVLVQTSCSTTWLAGQTCSPNPCPQPGACCSITGTCSLVQQPACNGSSIWNGASACSPNPCPPVGTCCAPNGSCLPRVQSACSAPSVWTAGGSCAPTPCPQLGGCCSPSGSCTLVVASACTTQWLLGVICSPNPCPQPTPCCDTTSGACQLVVPAACAGLSLAGAACSPNPCPLPGRCCTGTACSVGFRSACSGSWTVNATCAVNDCPSIGACCQGSSCSGLSQPDCSMIPGATFNGPLSACGPLSNLVPCCPVNFNHVNGLNAFDIFDFLNAWFALDPAADFTHDNTLSQADIFQFIADWFAGCS